MLDFSAEFQNGTAEVKRAWLEFTLADGTPLEFHEDRLLLNGLVRDTSTSVNGEFSVGAAVTTELSIRLNNLDEALSEYDFRKAVLVVWLGGEIPVLVNDIHPDTDVTDGTQFTITGLTEDELSLFQVNTQLDFGITDGEHDIARTYITAVSTSSGITTITVHDAVTITTENYISINQPEKVNYGRYYVDEYTYDGAAINLVAYDDMCKLDVKCKDTIYSWSSEGETIADLVDEAASVAGITVYNDTLPGPASYTITEKPNQWDTMTWHDVVSYCAQLMCCYAKIIYVPNPGAYRLAFDWYNTSQLTANQYDGGTFNTDTTPYSDGADLDGGTFNPWSTGDVVDGGDWDDGDDRSDVHIISAPFNLTVDTDDVLITGVTVSLDPSDNIEADEDTDTYITPLGQGETADYVIQISKNPLIETVTQALAVRNYLAGIIVGMRFRPLSASVTENPAMEAGDIAFVTGRNANTYACFLSHVTYTVAAQTSISCDAASTMQNMKSRYSDAQKTEALVQRIIERAVPDVETAMSGILGAIATTMGLNNFSYTDQSGATIYLFGNGSTLATSDIQWKFTAGALTVSSDGGQTFSAALSANGIAVLQELYAVKVNAENIVTGVLTLGGLNNTNGQLRVLNSSGVQIGQWNKDGIEAINLTAYGSLICYENYTVS